MNEVEEIEMLASTIGGFPTKATKAHQPHGIAVDRWIPGWLFSIEVLAACGLITAVAEYFHAR